MVYGVSVHKGIIIVLSLFKSHWLAVFYCLVFCIGHRRTGRGGDGGGGFLQPPKILGNLDFLGGKRNYLGKANYLRCFQAVF